MSEQQATRRAILTRAGGIAAIGALATVPAMASAPYSPEFLQWYAMAKKTPAVHEAFDAWEKAHPDASEEESKKDPISVHWDAMRVIEDSIFARPVRSWSDVAELGMIALYWSQKDLLPGDRSDDPLQFALGRDPDLESEYRGERPSAYLIQAVAKLAMERMGGADV